MTKHEILDETAAFYNKNNRGVNEQGCIYLNEDTGNMCAVGRCMTETALGLYKDFGGSASALGMNATENAGEEVNYFLGESLDLDRVLKDEYKGHSVMFWNNLQQFHDNKFNWDENGLTERGQNALEVLKKHYKDQ